MILWRNATLVDRSSNAERTRNDEGFWSRSQEKPCRNDYHGLRLGKLRSICREEFPAQHPPRLSPKDARILAIQLATTLLLSFIFVFDEEIAIDPVVEAKDAEEELEQQQQMNRSTTHAYRRVIASELFLPTGIVIIVCGVLMCLPFLRQASIPVQLRRSDALYHRRIICCGVLSDLFNPSKEYRSWLLSTRPYISLPGYDNDDALATRKVRHRASPAKSYRKMR